jgi:hypothetical protein
MFLLFNLELSFSVMANAWTTVQHFLKEVFAVPLENSVYLESHAILIDGGFLLFDLISVLPIMVLLSRAVTDMLYFSFKFECHKLIHMPKTKCVIVKVILTTFS